MGDFNQVEFGSDKLSLKRVYERIDRALSSKEWFTMFPDTGIKHYPIQISDHAPIELDLNLTKNISKKPYKLDAWVFFYEECLCIIKDAWRLRVWDSPAFQVARKLSGVHQCVRRWALDKRHEWRAKWDEFDVDLEKGIDAAICEGDDTLYTTVNERVREFSKVAAVFWRQKAKLRWVVDGDTCTKYFFNWVKGRAGRNFILGVKDGSGEWIYEPECVGKQFYDSFFSLYNPSDNNEDDSRAQLMDEVLRGFTKTVTNDDCDALNRPFTAQEVRTAVF
ncbi:uncharacterized protein LOC141629917 [Silene latifolia]|uniref:uncharacterized protein LOC141629917 n=1 Tax=Silene latifolia TaxID=37657 RepID=UPI003D77588D